MRAWNAMDAARGVVGRDRADRLRGDLQLGADERGLMVEIARRPVRPDIRQGEERRVAPDAGDAIQRVGDAGRTIVDRGGRPREPTLQQWTGDLDPLQHVLQDALCRS